MSNWKVFLVFFLGVYVMAAMNEPHHIWTLRMFVAAMMGGFIGVLLKRGLK